MAPRFIRPSGNPSRATFLFPSFLMALPGSMVIIGSSRPVRDRCPMNSNHAVRDVADAFAPTAALRRLGDNIAAVFLGKPEAVRLALVALLAEGHLLIEDVPGIG